MTPKEIIKYLTDNHLEYQMVDILMFNSYGFYFLPILGPHLDISGSNCSILDREGVNVLSSEYQLPTMNIGQLRKLMKGVNLYETPSKFLYAYIARYKERIFGELFYDKAKTGVKNVREAAFEEFLTIIGVNSLSQLRTIVREAEIEHQKQRKAPFYTQYINDTADLLFDNDVCNSINRRYMEDHINLSFLFAIDRANNVIYSNRYISVNNSMYFDGDKSITSISFSEDYVPLPVINVDLTRPTTILSKGESIPDILYKIAIEIKANELYIATGYAYKKGLDMLQPTINTVYHQHGKMELLIGDLQNYSPDKKQKCMNRETAEKINWMFESGLLKDLKTYVNSFYHGKFYYVSNGRITYVIMGSSNITESAYTKNNELDILLRFDIEDGQQSLLSEIKEWYDKLKSESVSLGRLNEELFQSNLYIDESKNVAGTLLFRKLTSEEEKERYNFLLKQAPTSIIEDAFSKSKDFKAFANYVAFVYAEYGLTIIESFSYGNSCYIFGTTDIDRIKHEIFRKSKEQAKAALTYVSDVQHNELYESEICNIINANRKL